MSLKLKRIGEIWHYSGTVAGTRLRGSTKTSQRTEAEKEANLVETRQLNRDRYGPGETLTFAAAAIEYRKHKTKGVPRHVKLVEDYWKFTLVKSITNGAVKRAAIELLPNAKGASRNRAVIAPTQAVINYAASLDLCPRLKVDRFPVVKVTKTPATWEWVQAFMAHASPHLGALCCFMFLTGARIGEAVGVTWGDVDLGKARVTIRMGKLGGEERAAHMPAELVAAIANIPSAREPDEPVFVYAAGKNCDDAWKVAERRAGIPHRSPHSCRHGFATGLLHRGVDAVTVAKRGGWKTPAMVFSIYGHESSDETVADLLIDTPLASEVVEKPQVSDTLA